MIPQRWRNEQPDYVTGTTTIGSLANTASSKHQCILQDCFKSSYFDSNWTCEYHFRLPL